MNPNSYNKYFKWEKTTQYNTGLDFGILKRVTGSIDYWRKEINDLLYNSFLPAGANLDSKVDGNIASMDSQGIDLDLNIKVVNTNKNKFNVGLNMGWVCLLKTSKCV